MDKAGSYEARGLPEEPIAAAAAFHADHLGSIEQLIAGDLASVVVIFDPGDHEQRDWRLAAVRNLARKYAPVRVNGVAGTAGAIAPLLDYLASAPGVTGQLLEAA